MPPGGRTGGIVRPVAGWRVVALALALAMASAPPAFAQAPSSVASKDENAARAEAAEAFLADLAAGRYEEAARRLAPDAAARLAPDAARRASAARLADTWQSEGLANGALLNRGAGQPRVAGGRRILAVTLQFERATLQAQLRLDPDHRIVAFRLVSGADAIGDLLVGESEVRALPILVGDLPGVLTLPAGDGPFPAVVLVHGSGLADRDSRIGPNTPFRDLANGLAHLDVATLRYDKRPLAQQRTLGPTANADDVTVNDAVAAIALLARQPGVDRGRIFVAGHSLGGLLAPRIAARAPDTDGVIMLSALARPFHHAIADQVRYLAEADGRVSELERASVAQAVRQRDEIDAMLAGGPEPRDPLLRIPAAYWRHLATYDALAAARDLHLPMLFIQGGRDYQVTARDDLARWRAALQGRDDVVFREYPALNHFLLPGEGPPGSREYFTPGRLDTEVILDIAAWIHAREPRESR
ncbi:MAG TPA: alpha/beta fold hydrolase [Arenimonas sp.]|uniref:alpha/beta hydrolase family protein n=1 Tax=Arenimonas sp. TaxID=1872635 RepID=UPI002D7EA4EF|nr:alpha/beta fold hydrolase [Arenimonas sp.]HEU0151830.1 alpha/beta fold hydrolase [Arenimonas sp.]